MIELAAACWKIDLPAAVRRLAQQGVGLPSQFLLTTRLDAYAARVRLRRQDFRGQLQQAARELRETSDPLDLALLEVCQLDTVRSEPDWSDRAGRFVGLLSARLCDATFREKKFHQGQYRFFRGRGWRNVVTVPFSDLPGRICGLLAIGRQARREHDWVYCPARVPEQRTRSGAGALETGLAFYSVLHETTCRGPYGHTKFIGPVAEVLRMQTKHLRDSAFPLPVVGFLGGRGLVGHAHLEYRCRATCKLLTGHALVLWNDVPTAELFNMAARCQGRVVLTGHRRFPGLIDTPHSRLTYLAKEALPWQTLLYEVLQKAPAIDKAEILRGLELDEHQFQELYRGANEECRALLNRNLNREALATTVVLGKKRVTCTTDGWIVEPGGTQICDACLYIDRTIRRTDNGTNYYRGRIVHQAKTYPFTELAEVVNRGTFAWMRQTVQAAGGSLIQFQPGWSFQAVHLATQFQPPRHEESRGRFGWCDRERAITLPYLTLPLGGRLREQTEPLLDQLSPGRHLHWQTDQVLPPAVFADTPEMRIFWATAAAISLNVLAVPLQQPACGLGLLGLGAALGGRAAARALGCSCYDLPTGPDYSVREQLDRATTAHGWPLLVNPTRNPNSQRALLFWLQNPTSRNAILEVDRKLAAGLKVHPHWRFVGCDDPVTDVSTIQQYGSPAFLTWLEHWLIRQLALPGRPELSWGCSVLYAMKSWAEQLGHTTLVFDEAERLLDETAGDPNHLAAHFVATIFRLLEDKRLKAARAGYEDAAHDTCLVGDSTTLGGHVFVPKKRVHQSLLDECLPVWDSRHVADALRQAGALVQEVEYRGVEGWLLARPWWDLQEKLYRAQRQRVLRIVG
jgi:hypothetical protein